MLLLIQYEPKTKQEITEGLHTAGGKYCRRCEYYFFTERLFCECRGMRLRASPTNRVFKEKVRAKKKLIGLENLF